ncbi:MAG: alpha-L-rhamnosidase N-terminal domain-containing protein, partial [Cyclobacteriaceae bacterium]|nr:alpha-L-rhamnosidase N-terminal domain-containing protein [Cyclobacteriaceae bacterium]
MKIRLHTILLASLVSLYVAAQHPASELKPWKAQWITGPGSALNLWSGVYPNELKEYAVFKFRKNFSLEAKPASFVIHVSADNRYKLYVNGALVSLGPARGDVFHWNYETVDIAAHLKAGDNVLAAVVWNDGPDKPEAQISLMTAFIVQGQSASEDILNTNASWKCIKDESHQPLPVRSAGYYVAGPGELLNMHQHITGWEKVGFDDSGWKPARLVLQGLPKGVFTFAPTSWMLVPSPIPQMTLREQRMESVRKASGVNVPATFPKSKTPVTIPAKTKASLLIDNGVLTNAYPVLQFSGGSNATFSISYAEALYIH